MLHVDGRFRRAEPPVSGLAVRQGDVDKVHVEPDGEDGGPLLDFLGVVAVTWFVSLPAFDQALEPPGTANQSKREGDAGCDCPVAGIVWGEFQVRKWVLVLYTEPERDGKSQRSGDTALRLRLIVWLGVIVASLSGWSSRTAGLARGSAGRRCRLACSHFVRACLHRCFLGSGRETSRRECAQHSRNQRLLLLWRPLPQGLRAWLDTYTDFLRSNTIILPPLSACYPLTWPVDQVRDRRGRLRPSLERKTGSSKRSTSGVPAGRGPACTRSRYGGDGVVGLCISGLKSRQGKLLVSEQSVTSPNLASRFTTGSRRGGLWCETRRPAPASSPLRTGAARRGMLETLAGRGGGRVGGKERNRRATVTSPTTKRLACLAIPGSMSRPHFPQLVVWPLYQRSYLPMTLVISFKDTFSARLSLLLRRRDEVCWFHESGSTRVEVAFCSAAGRHVRRSGAFLIVMAFPSLLKTSC